MIKFKYTQFFLSLLTILFDLLFTPLLLYFFMHVCYVLQRAIGLGEKDTDWWVVFKHQLLLLIHIETCRTVTNDYFGNRVIEKSDD